MVAAPGPQIDTLIVGGGSAGAVLASRLSEDQRHNVLLIEAGPNITADGTPPEIASAYAGIAYFDPRFTMSYPGALAGGAHWNDAAARPRISYAQGRVLGGGSTVNGIAANRGAPSDYDEWAELGAEGWDWKNVLPYFRKLERDLDFEGPLHGNDGPLPIRSVPADWRSAYVGSAVAALTRRGVPEHPDQNGPWIDGMFAQRVNLDENMRRVPTALGWLSPTVRARPNLAIMTGARVMRVAFDGRRAIGVQVDLGGDDTLLLARRTILSAGAFGTPSLLMRSGVGPQEHLRTRGVAVVHHLAGVGRNLMDHPYAGISQHLPRGSRLPAMDRHHIPVVWRFSSGHEGCPDGDMHMGFIGRVAWHAMGRRIGALAFWVNKSFSRGHVTLAAQPGDPPDIDLRLLSDPRDRARLRDAFRMAAGLAADIAATGQAGPPLPARLSDRARRFGPKTTGNALLMGLAAAAVDLAGPFAPRLSAALSYAGPSLADLLADEAALDRYLDESVTGVWHPCGTCRMGRADDPLSVTDPSGRVHGIDDLFICDASLFPSIPRANLNIPVIMTAERIAHLLRSRSLT